MSEKIVVPHFATEFEEADWWFEHREEHDKIMAKAMDEGRALTMKQMLASRGIRAPRVTVPLDFDDMQRARIQANERGINYEDYIRQLLHVALEKDDAA